LKIFTKNEAAVLIPGKTLPDIRLFNNNDMDIDKAGLHISNFFEGRLCQINDSAFYKRPSIVNFYCHAFSAFQIGHLNFCAKRQCSMGCRERILIKAFTAGSLSGMVFHGVKRRLAGFCVADPFRITSKLRAGAAEEEQRYTEINRNFYQ
jgi:hypothetical protein